MIENLVDMSVVALLGVVTALVCNRFLCAPKNEPESRYRREEVQIDPEAQHAREGQLKPWPRPSGG